MSNPIYMTPGRAGMGFYSGLVNRLKDAGSNVVGIPNSGFTFADGMQTSRLSFPGVDMNEFKRSPVFVVQRLKNPFYEMPLPYVAKNLLSLENPTEQQVRDELEGSLGRNMRTYEFNPDGSLKDYVIAAVSRALYGDSGSEESKTNAIIGSLTPYTQTRSPADELDELAKICANLSEHRDKDSPDIVAVAPYLDGRSDKNFDGELVVSRYTAKLLKLSGVNSILSWRRHSDGQSEIYKEEGIRFIDVYDRGGRAEFVNTLTDYLRGVDLLKKASKLVVVGPDQGAGNEAIAFSEDLTRKLREEGVLAGDEAIPYTIFEKSRGGRAHHVEKMEIDEGFRDFKGDEILIYRDDMLDTTGTARRFMKLVKEQFGNEDTIMVVDHLVLSRPGLDNLRESHRLGTLAHVIAALTVQHQGLPDWFSQVPIGSDFVDEISTLADQR